MTMRQAIPGQAGFTLLEVLIAVVVLSFGVLGMVGLQAASLQANRDARLQSSAVRLARELADMMRGNKNVAILTTTGGNPYLVDTNSAAYPAVSNCFITTCASQTNVAASEMYEWMQRVTAELPGARVAVCFDSDPYDANGLPQWTCSGTGSVSVVKIGWTRLSTKRASAGTGAGALDLATSPTAKPTVVLPLIAGS